MLNRTIDTCTLDILSKWRTHNNEFEIFTTHHNNSNDYNNETEIKQSNKQTNSGTTTY